MKKKIFLKISYFLYIPRVFSFIFLLQLALCKSGEVDLEAYIDCTYSNVNHLAYGSTFTCTVKDSSDITQPNTTITGINTCSKPKGGEKEVEIFYAVAKIIRYIPSGFKEFFPNIWGLRLDNTQLKYVTKEDFKQFGTSLKMFTSYLNHIEFLEKDLFIYNTEIEYVNFRLNRIRYIDPAIFDNLKSLNNLWLDGTAIACGFTGATSISAAKKLVKLLKSSECSNLDNAPPFYIVNKKIKIFLPTNFISLLLVLA